MNRSAADMTDAEARSFGHVLRDRLAELDAMQVARCLVAIAALLLVLVTLVAAAVPLRKLGSEALLAGGDRAMLEFSPMFALMWLVGAGAAIGAVWQAKYH
ncbi:hypothetical protein NK983_25880, partial [Salmonella enterica subsp. enterica serovar Typhimurium]|nr:hypothetical protein [Salmonella enterica subsp. enterica serovar Typhimurium]